MWRVGKGLTHVFCGDQPAAFCDTPEIAARIVAAMNAAEAQPELDAGRICRHGKIELECGACGPAEPARKVCNGNCSPTPLAFDPDCPLHCLDVCLRM